jgi:hypothetical protein
MKPPTKQRAKNSQSVNIEPDTLRPKGVKKMAAPEAAPNTIIPTPITLKIVI